MKNYLKKNNLGHPYMQFFLTLKYMKVKINSYHNESEYFFKQTMKFDLNNMKRAP